MDERAATKPGSGRTVAVVLTYRRPRMASQSVRYLLQDEGMHPQDVIVIVNGEGGIDDELASAVDVRTLESNGGPAGGMRAGLLAAVEDPDVEWIYLCEDDIGASGVGAPRLERLRRAAADRNDTEGCRPIGGIVAYGRLLDPRTGLTRPYVPGPDESGLIPVDVASWGASLVARAVVDAGVLPDADLFFGYEDFDFWLSTRTAGFDVVLDVESARELGLSVHPSGREAALGSERIIDDTEPWRRYYEARNFVHLRRNHGRTSWTVMHLGKSVRRGMLGSGSHRRAILSGLADGLRGRTGPNPDHLRPIGTGERELANEHGSAPVIGDDVPPPVFVVGCGRSGTTMLRAMLDSHPDVAVPPESYFVVSLLKQRAVFERTGVLDRTALLDEIVRAPSFAEWRLDRSELESWSGFVTARDVPAAIAAVYQCYAQRDAKHVAVDKTPFLAPKIGLLADSFPGTRFVHLVRDGRNVAQSLAEMDFGPRTLDGGILEWRRQVDAVERHVERGLGDVLTVRYEDLVADPRTVLTRVCAHIGLDFDDAMLTFPERADRVLAGITRTAHLDGIRQAPTRDPRSWRDQVSSEQVALLEALAGDTLVRHGYELACPPTGPLIGVRRARAHVGDTMRSLRLGVGARRARHLRRRRTKSGRR